MKHLHIYGQSIQKRASTVCVSCLGAYRRCSGLDTPVILGAVLCLYCTLLLAAQAAKSEEGELAGKVKSTRQQLSEGDQPVG